MTKLRQIKIKWSEGFAGAPDKAAVENTGSGIYQFYGKHPVYGKDALLYIGKACNFAERIEGHRRNGYLSNQVPECIKPEKVKIYLGEISEDSEIGSEILEEIEKLLIFIHSPAWNSCHIAYYERLPQSNIKILNCGEYGGLLPIVKESDIPFSSSHSSKKSS